MKKFSEYYTELTQSLKIGEIDIGWEKQGSKISLQTPIEFIIEVNFTITL